MRLIGTFETENEAYSFYSFLLKEGVQNIYEPFKEKSGEHQHYRIWIYDEDDLEVATEWLKKFKENPNDPQFFSPGLPVAATPPPPNYNEISQKEELKWQPVRSIPTPRRRFPITLTHWIIILCGFLFLWNDMQEERIVQDKGPLAVQIALTPLMKTLLFDVPSSYQSVEQVLTDFPFKTYKEEKDLPQQAQAQLEAAEAASWKGFFYSWEQKKQGQTASTPLFEKIREGEVWRLFTPCLLHRDFLHILFNMIWVWILLKQIEERLSAWKICLMVLIIGVVSNVTQYLISGPYFLGFSGVVVGLAGFIWMRQKYAPWEGYPLEKSTLLFLLFFVLAMFALELFTLGLQLFSVVKLTANIANTAHIIGGLVGMFLGRMPFFGRRIS